MRALAAVVVLLVAACGGSAPPAAPTAKLPTAAPPTPAYDLAAVKANFKEECADPVVLDERTCKQIKIDGMTADGVILNVPTTLEPGISDEAKFLCKQMTFAHFDSDAKPLGYEIVGILDKNGGNAAACTIDE